MIVWLWVIIATKCKTKIETQKIMWLNGLTGPQQDKQIHVEPGNCNLHIQWQYQYGTSIPQSWKIRTTNQQVLTTAHNQAINQSINQSAVHSNMITARIENRHIVTYIYKIKCIKQRSAPIDKWVNQNPCRRSPHTTIKTHVHSTNVNNIRVSLFQVHLKLLRS